MSQEKREREEEGKKTMEQFNYHTLLVKCKTVMITLKKMATLKFKISITEISTCAQKGMYKNVHYSSDLKTTNVLKEQNG